MVNKSNEPNRRILNFPAIRPCESVPFPSLLASLIDLSRSICRLKSRTFYTNKRSATRSIHLIETLLVFLEELRNGGGGGGGTRSDSSTALCLSELHFTFQKLLLLLDDCTRADARLWMLFKSEEASTHFRLLFSAVAAALDVLPPPESSDGEVLEVVEFVRRQAVKSDFEVERDGRQAMRTVHRAFDRFGRGIAPESTDLKRVLDFLKIESWGECNGEIKWLMSEFDQECQTAQKRDAAFLSSLVAFLIFCRCTLFSSVEKQKARDFQESSEQSVTGLNRDDFKCPITLEIMSDPVTLSTGHTYDRSSIVTWFSSGNHTCPKTGEKLICVDFVQNLALKHLIALCFQENGIKADESRSSSAVEARSVAAEQAMALLANFLVSKLVAGTEEEQIKAVFEIRLLTKSSNFNRSCFVEADVILPLLDSISSSSREMQDHAMAALFNLSKYSRSKTVMVENGGLEAIVEILNYGLKMEARQHAAGVLFYLSAVEDNRRKIGRTHGAISGLLGVLRDGDNRGKKCALAAILGLLVHHENHWRFLGGGLIMLLVNLLKTSENEDLMADSLAVLATLAVRFDGAVAIVSAGIPALAMQILGSSGSRAAREYGVSLLLSLCSNDAADVVPVLVANPSLMVSLYSLIAEGSPRSSKKAASLIKILHAFNERGSSSIAQEQFVRVW